MALHHNSNIKLRNNSNKDALVLDRKLLKVAQIAKLITISSFQLPQARGVVLILNLLITSEVVWPPVSTEMPKIVAVPHKV